MTWIKNIGDLRDCEVYSLTIMQIIMQIIIENSQRHQTCVIQGNRLIRRILPTK